MSDPLAPVEAQLSALPVRAIEVRRFRRSMDGFGKRAALWLVDEFMGGEDHGGEGEGDDPPGIEVLALLADGGQRNMGELHPIASEHKWVAQARAIRMAQRRGVPIQFKGSGVLASATEFYVPVADRMRRPAGRGETPIDDPAATLRKLGWEVSDDGSTVSYRFERGRRPGLAFLGLAILVLWFVAVPIMFLTLIIRPAREFFIGIVQTLWTLATKRSRQTGQLRIVGDGIHIVETREDDRTQRDVPLDAVFAVGLDIPGWAQPGDRAYGIAMWTDTAVHTFGPPSPSSDKERASDLMGRDAVLALEAWVWTRLGALR